jgi:predicted phosphohydrolase
VEDFQGIGKTLVLVGALVLFVGLILIAAEKVNFPFLGRLPGDIYIRRKNFQFYFPIATSIVLSLVLSLIFYLISHFSRK